VHGIVPADFPEGKPGIVFDFKDDYKTDGKYDRKDELTTRITARVIDVKPNGNLVLESRNDVKFGEEDYTVTLTGVCRSADVTPQNTVLSSQIAELNISVEDRGAVRDATRRGWLQRLHDFLRPF
jgi:flagellar L-ring protein precursor FlgH